MRRREFVALLGSAMASPIVRPPAAHAQRATPVVGYLHGASPKVWEPFKASFLDGLKQTGYVDGRNVRMEYRFASGAYERLARMADELVAQRVALITTGGITAARVAKAASIKVSPPIPVVFALGSDPVADGLVPSLHRPGANVTGVTSIAGALAPKRLELLRDLHAHPRPIAIVINPNSLMSRRELAEAEAASRSMGQQLVSVTATNVQEIEQAFAGLKQRNVGSLVIAVDAFFFGQIRRLAALSARHVIPAIGPLREFAAAGGLMSYGTSIHQTVRQAGLYVGKILNGARAADLPVLQPTTFDLVVNLRAARALGMTIPPTLLARADEVIE